jgi:hypothetical protein
MQNQPNRLMLTKERLPPTVQKNVVEPRGFEPLTSSVRGMRSPS